MRSRFRPIPLLLVANLALFAFAVSYVNETAAAAQEVESFCDDTKAELQVCRSGPVGSMWLHGGRNRFGLRLHP